LAADVRGLILTGGASSRMGRDKAEIVYAQLPQWRAVEELLRPLCAEVFWSCTPTQQAQWGIGDRAIVDVVAGTGPASGLHAAFTFRARNIEQRSEHNLKAPCEPVFLRSSPLVSSHHAAQEEVKNINVVAATSAWLVVGCDYPLIETRDLQSLLHARSPDADAVVFFDEHKNEIEPMIALWEPSAQAQFLAAFERGEFSPRRILRSCKLKMIQPRDHSILSNRNTPS
jgi:molybdopterin-guanine dinucleotide biosynthesis protein A